MLPFHTALKTSLRIGLVLLLAAGCRASFFEHSTESILDEVFLQEIEEEITSANGLPGDDVRDIYVEDGRVWFATDKGLASFDGTKWWKFPDTSDDNLASLANGADSRIWAGTQSTLKELTISLEDKNYSWAQHSLSGLGASLTTIAAEKDVGIWVGTDKGLYLFKDETFTSTSITFSVTAILENGDKLFVGGMNGLYVSEQGSMVSLTTSDGLLSNEIRALSASPDNDIWIGTPNGISILSNNEFISFTGKDGLPYEKILDIFISPDGEVLVSSEWGTMRREGDKWHYYAGRRWVPDDRVSTCAIDSNGTIWLGSSKGLGMIRRVEMTLEEKARHYEEITQSRHNRYGMISGAGLRSPGDLSSLYLADDDNDGQYTQFYIAGEAFRYAVTKDPSVKRQARQSLEAMFMLEQLPREVGNPGFVARSYISMLECARKGCEYMENSGKYKCWIPDKSGNYCFKNDTSSDEITGHMLGYSVYYDLAADESERKEIRDVVGRIMSHIVDNGYKLIDLDGTPTTYGRWDPEHVDTGGNVPVEWKGKTYYAGQYYLDALEILGYLRVAYHITRDKKFLEHYHHLINEHQYHKKAAAWKMIYMIVPSLNSPLLIHYDDELAYFIYYPLLKYETGQKLRQIYMDSMRLSFDIEWHERCPLFNFVYGAFAGGDFGLADAIGTFREYPWSLIKWTMRNSQRADIEIAPESRSANKELESTEVLPYKERRVHRWDGNPYELDGGSGGYGEEAGTTWLSPYWMGRYHGFIKVPASK